MKVLPTLALFCTSLFASHQSASAADILSKYLHNSTCHANMTCNFEKTQAADIHLQAMTRLEICRSSYLDRAYLNPAVPCEAVAFNKSYPTEQRALAMIILGHAYLHKDINEIGFNAPALKRTFDIWQQASELDSKSIDGYLAAGDLYKNLNMLIEAQAEIDHAEKRSPDDWRVYTHRALSLLNFHEHEGALVAALAAYKLNPQEPEVNYAFGKTLLTANKLTEAEEQMKLATVGFNPFDKSHYEMMKLESPWSVLATIYDAKNEPEKAADALTQEIEIPNVLIDLFFFMGRRAGYYERAGQFEKAAADLDMAAKNAPENYAKDLIVRRDILLAKSNADGKAIQNLKTVLARGNLKPILQVQVFLKNQGYRDVEINGVFDEKTKAGLEACALDKKCVNIIGQKI